MKLYAYIYEGKSGIFNNWDDCSSFVKGKNNIKYKKFSSEIEANNWISDNLVNNDITARELAKKNYDNTVIYFDAGTGRGIGVEVRVTDCLGNSLLHKISMSDSFIDLCNRHGFILNDFGNLQLPEKYTNNYGEALGCILAYKIAGVMPNVKTILGDSKLVIEYWSNGAIKIKNEETIKMLQFLMKLKESSNILLKWIPGSANMADLGFHKD